MAVEAEQQTSMGITLTGRLLPFKRAIIENLSAPGELDLGGMPV